MSLKEATKLVWYYPPWNEQFLHLKIGAWETIRRHFEDYVSFREGKYWEKKYRSESA